MNKSFERKIESLEQIHQFISQFIELNPLNDKVTYYMDFVVEELFTNAVKYNPEGTQDISLDISINRNQLIISITDTGEKPFDITKTETFDRTMPIENRRVGGLGIPLVKQMADKIDFQYKDNQNKITLIKYLE